MNLDDSVSVTDWCLGLSTNWVLKTLQAEEVVPVKGCYDDDDKMTRCILIFKEFLQFHRKHKVSFFVR